MRTIRNERELLIEKYIPPTIIREKGNKFWYNKYGELDSVNNQPARSFTFGHGRVFEMWFENGKLIKQRVVCEETEKC